MSAKFLHKRSAIRDCVCELGSAEDRDRLQAFVDRKLTPQTLVEPSPGTRVPWVLDLEGTGARTAQNNTAKIASAISLLYGACKGTPSEMTIGAPRSAGTPRSAPRATSTVPATPATAHAIPAIPATVPRASAGVFEDEDDDLSPLPKRPRKQAHPRRGQRTVLGWPSS